MRLFLFKKTINTTMIPTTTDSDFGFGDGEI